MKKFKKSMALASAFIMGASALPLEVMATSWAAQNTALNINLIGGPQRVPSGTAFFEPGSEASQLTGAEGAVGSGRLGDVRAGVAGAGGFNPNASHGNIIGDVNHIARGTWVAVEVPVSVARTFNGTRNNPESWNIPAVESNAWVDLRLDGAQWIFNANHDGDDTRPENARPDGTRDFHRFLAGSDSERNNSTWGSSGSVWDNGVWGGTNHHGGMHANLVMERRSGDENFSAPFAIGVGGSIGNASHARLYINNLNQIVNLFENGTPLPPVLPTNPVAVAQLGSFVLPSVADWRADEVVIADLEDAIETHMNTIMPTGITVVSVTVQAPTETVAGVVTVVLPAGMNPNTITRTINPLGSNLPSNATITGVMSNFDLSDIDWDGVTLGDLEGEVEELINDIMPEGISGVRVEIVAPTVPVYGGITGVGSITVFLPAEFDDEYLTITIPALAPRVITGGAQEVYEVLPPTLRGTDTGRVLAEGLDEHSEDLEEGGTFGARPATGSRTALQSFEIFFTPLDGTVNDEIIIAVIMVVNQAAATAIANLLTGALGTILDVIDQESETESEESEEPAERIAAREALTAAIVANTAIDEPNIGSIYESHIVAWRSDNSIVNFFLTAQNGQINAYVALYGAVRSAVEAANNAGVTPDSDHEIAAIEALTGAITVAATMLADAVPPQPTAIDMELVVNALREELTGLIGNLQGADPGNLAIADAQAVLDATDPAATAEGLDARIDLVQAVIDALLPTRGNPGFNVQAEFPGLHGLVGTDFHNVYANVSNNGELVSLVILVPLVIRTTDETVSLELANANGITLPNNLNTQRMQIATSVGGGTTASFGGGVGTARHTLIRELTIREQVAGAMPESGSFELVAPAGFSFRRNANVGNADGYGAFHADPSNQLRVGASSFPAVGGVTSQEILNRNIAFTFLNNDRILRVDYTGLTRTGHHVPAAHLRLDNITLVADNWDAARTGNVEIQIRSGQQHRNQFIGVRNTSGTLLAPVPATGNPPTGGVAGTPLNPHSGTVSTQTLNFGTIADWNVVLTALEDPTQLVSGRFESEITAGGSIDDEHHLAARIRIGETLIGSWNLDRVTTIRLPEEVTIRQAEIVNRGNDQNVSNGLWRPDLSNEATGYEYHNLNSRADNIRIDNNLLHLNSIRRPHASGSTPQTGDNAHNWDTAAAIYLDLHLSIDPAFSGDIVAYLEGSAITGNDAGQSVVIAEAIAPLTLVTEVRNVRVGYQFLPVGNFSIIENVAGALLEGEEVFISLTDDIFSELHIAPGFLWDVTEGDLDIRSMRINGVIGAFQQGRNTAQVIFEINRGSTEASRIDFTNVQVRLLATAPVSNVGYDIIVWGPAVARNVNHPLVWDYSRGNASDNPAGRIPTAAQWNRLVGEGTYTSHINQEIYLTTLVSESHLSD